MAKRNQDIMDVFEVKKAKRKNHQIKNTIFENRYN